MKARQAKKKSGKEDIMRALFERIYEGVYGSGARLKELELATEFGVSRTPVREILQHLARLRLVRIIPNKGAEVIGLTVDDVAELYEIRMALELLALESALPSIRLRELSEFRKRFQAIRGDVDPQEMSNLDNELHGYITRASNKPRLEDMLLQLLWMIERFRFVAYQDPAGVERSNREHLELIDALFKRDLGRARSVLADHLEKSKLVAISYLSHNTNLPGWRGVSRGGFGLVRSTREATGQSRKTGGGDHRGKGPDQKEPAPTKHTLRSRIGMPRAL
jgi:DNA-binding GntR family transcriptional regulator